ncbi:hypothetical protein BS50DRAFT_570115 [Corynespora cassiicola Philippines]|uniref:Uncharacterized protein n=1 Tax=Corynespora cassiicola Philippines TaxID=1448308 RepID=A0A2T2NZP9_CORCC|nr:hypothetical protein BS50DRAFT_570115 [Corynespora cassiicola Philippines]
MLRHRRIEIRCRRWGNIDYSSTSHDPSPDRTTIKQHIDANHQHIRTDYSSKVKFWLF